MGVETKVISHSRFFIGKRESDEIKIKHGPDHWPATGIFQTQATDVSPATLSDSCAANHMQSYSSNLALFVKEAKTPDLQPPCSTWSRDATA